MFDFEAVAKAKLHYGHVAFLGCTEDEGTYRANRKGFKAVPAARPATRRHQQDRHVRAYQRWRRVSLGVPRSLSTAAPLWSRGLPGLHRGRRDVSGQPQGVQSSTSCASGDSSTSARPTCPCVPEVAAGVAGRAPIIVDGGFRRGTDIFKALALGATAVGVGRPYIFGLAAFGQAGVETVLDILDSELRMLMRQAGTPSLAKITKAYVVDRSRRM